MNTGRFYTYAQVETARSVTLVATNNYKKVLPTIFTGCDAVLDVDGKPRWKDFAIHIETYSESCGGATK